MIIATLSLSDSQAAQILELINRAPTKGEEAEAVCELKSLLRAPFAPKPPAVEPPEEVPSFNEAED